MDQKLNKTTGMFRVLQNFNQNLQKQYSQRIVTITTLDGLRSDFSLAGWTVDKNLCQIAVSSTDHHDSNIFLLFFSSNPPRTTTRRAETDEGILPGFRWDVAGQANQLRITCWIPKLNPARCAQPERNQLDRVLGPKRVDQGTLGTRIAAEGVETFSTTSAAEPERGHAPVYKKRRVRRLATHTFLGLLAKIKCSICSYQFNVWYVGHWSTTILNLFFVG
jgi:hypothetical protein